MKLLSKAFKTPIFSLSFSIALAFILFSISACTNTTKPEDTKKFAVEETQVKTDNTNDAKFLIAAAQINLEEIQLGQLAQRNSTMRDVKELGKMMEADHTKALKEVKDLANLKQVTVPATLTDEGQSAYMKLVKKTGKDFDKSYCDMMVDGHKEAISKFEKEVNESSDSDIKSWATSMLPGLKMHLDHATSCQKECVKM